MNVRNKLQQKAEKDFSVRPSPLNPVKFELGIIIAVSLLLWFGVHLSINDPIAQISVLFLFSLLAAAWIVLRIKFLLQKMPLDNKSNH